MNYYHVQTHIEVKIILSKNTTKNTKKKTLCVKNIISVPSKSYYYVKKILKSRNKMSNIIANQCHNYLNANYHAIFSLLLILYASLNSLFIDVFSRIFRKIVFEQTN